MTTIRSVALAALALSLAATRATAQQDTLRLSVDQAIAFALRNNPAIRAVRNDEDVADWDVREAYGSLLPFASVGAGLSWQDSGEQRFGSLTLAQNQPAYYLSSYDLGLSYQLDRSKLLAPSAARARRSATTAQIHAAELNLDASVTRAYLEVLRRQEGEVIARQQLERSRFNLRLAQGQMEVGTVTPLDVRQADLQVGRSEVDLLQAANQVNTARLRLLEQLGIEEDRPLDLTTHYEVEVPTWERDDLLARAIAHNPTLAARNAEADAGRVEVKQARSAYLPSVSARAGISGFTRQASSTDRLISAAQSSVADQVGSCVTLNEIYSRLTPALPTRDCSSIRFTDAQRNAIVAQNSSFPFDFTKQPASASLTISLPIFQGLGRERQVEAAKARREDADEMVREQRIALASDVTIGLATVNTAYQSALLETRNRSVADEQLRLAGERYRVGAISFVDLVVAATAKAEADQSYVNAIYAYHDLVADLEALVGESLR